MGGLHVNNSSSCFRKFESLAWHISLVLKIIVKMHSSKCRKWWQITSFIGYLVVYRYFTYIMLFFVQITPDCGLLLNSAIILGTNMVVLSNLYAAPFFKNNPHILYLQYKLKMTSLITDLNENEHFGWVFLKIIIFGTKTGSLHSGTVLFFQYVI